MPFFSSLIVSLALLSCPTSAASLSQLLSSSHIADLTTIDTTTMTTLSKMRQYQYVKTDNNMIQTTITTQQSMMSPFNQTIIYEVGKLSGTGALSLDGPIYQYTSTSFANTVSGSGRTWTSCASSSQSERVRDYCTEILEPNEQTYTCGRDMNQTCYMSEFVCRHNNRIEPSIYYMLDINTAAIVSSMNMINPTTITYWSNLNDKPTIDEFGDAIFLPARTSCPDNNQMFPATFATAPVLPNSATTAASPDSTEIIRNGSLSVAFYNNPNCSGSEPAYIGYHSSISYTYPVKPSDSASGLLETPCSTPEELLPNITSYKVTLMVPFITPTYPNPPTSLTVIGTMFTTSMTCQFNFTRPNYLQINTIGWITPLAAHNDSYLTDCVRYTLVPNTPISLRIAVSMDNATAPQIPTTVDTIMTGLPSATNNTTPSSITTNNTNTTGSSTATNNTTPPSITTNNTNTTGSPTATSNGTAPPIATNTMTYQTVNRALHVYTFILAICFWSIW